MSCMEQKTIFVKVGRMGERIKELCLFNSERVDSILTKADISINPVLDEVLINGVIVTYLNTVAHDKDIILIQKKQTKMIGVKVSRVGQKIYTIHVPEKSTADYCLISAGMRPLIGEDIFLHTDDKSKGQWIDGKQVPLQDSPVKGQVTR